MGNRVKQKGYYNLMVIIAFTFDTFKNYLETPVLECFRSSTNVINLF